MRGERCSDQPGEAHARRPGSARPRAAGRCGRSTGRSSRPARAAGGILPQPMPTPFRGYTV